MFPVEPLGITIDTSTELEAAVLCIERNMIDNVPDCAFCNNSSELAWSIALPLNLCSRSGYVVDYVICDLSISIGLRTEPPYPGLGGLEIWVAK